MRRSRSSVPVTMQPWKQAYTSGEAEDLLRDPDPIGVLFGSGLYGRQRLRRLVEHYLDDNLLQAIAREDQKGRRLFVVTTDLDAKRAVIWDMGAIAASGAPNAFKLFRAMCSLPRPASRSRCSRRS